VVEAYFAARPAPPGQENAGRTAVEVYANRKIPPSDFSHGPQPRLDFFPPMTFSGIHDLFEVRVTFE
jgi:hypothetical protein